MREHHRLFKSYCLETNPRVKLTKHNNYKKIRNIVVSKIKESKKQYYQNYFQRNSKNLKKNNMGWYKISFNTEIHLITHLI